MGSREVAIDAGRPGLAGAVAKATIGALVFVAGGYLAWRYDLPLSELSAKTSGVDPAWSWTLFIAVYGAISVFPIPGRDVAKIVGVELFGYGSIVAVWIGELIAAACAYWLARAGGHDLVRLLLSARAERLDRRLERADSRTIFLLRINPIVPYRYFNLSAGLVRLSFRPFMLGSIPGVLIRTAAFQVAFVLLGETLNASGVTTWQVFVVSILLVPPMLGAWWWMRSRRRVRA